MCEKGTKGQVRRREGVRDRGTSKEEGGTREGCVREGHERCISGRVIKHTITLCTAQGITNVIWPSYGHLTSA